MFNRTIYTPRTAGLALLASAMLASPANAKDPGVIRTFAVFLLPGVDVDFTNEDSVLIKVEKNEGSSQPTLDFVNCNPDISDFNFDGTRWVFQPAMFITKGEGRKIIGSFAWLLDEATPVPPPANAVAMMGADEFILQEKVFVRTCVSGNCCFTAENDGKKALTASTSESPVIVVMAGFSK